MGEDIIDTPENCRTKVGYPLSYFLHRKHVADCHVTGGHLNGSSGPGRTNHWSCVQPMVVVILETLLVEYLKNYFKGKGYFIPSSFSSWDPPLPFLADAPKSDVIYAPWRLWKTMAAACVVCLAQRSWDGWVEEYNGIQNGLPYPIMQQVKAYEDWLASLAGKRRLLVGIVLSLPIEETYIRTSRKLGGKTEWVAIS